MVDTSSLRAIRSRITGINAFRNKVRSDLDNDQPVDAGVDPDWDASTTCELERLRLARFNLINY